MSEVGGKDSSIQFLAGVPPSLRNCSKTGRSARLTSEANPACAQQDRRRDVERERWVVASRIDNPIIPRKRSVIAPVPRLTRARRRIHSLFSRSMGFWHETRGLQPMVPTDCKGVKWLKRYLMFGAALTFFGGQSDRRCSFPQVMFLLGREPRNSACNFKTEKLRCVQADRKLPEQLLESATMFTERSMPKQMESANKLSVISSAYVERVNQAGDITCQENISEQAVRSSDAADLTLLEQKTVSNAVVIVFDIETTGFRISSDRIVEFAARDLAGGSCSTMQTLVNPDMPVPLHATNVHGISTEMVNRPDIPRWKDVAPVLVQFVASRRQEDGPVILVAHNGKRFDVPFLIKEFQRCSMQVPPWWQFLDTVPLAREAMKSKGLKASALRLSALHEYYALPFAGRAHRAMADVHMLAGVLQRLTFDLKMPVSVLLERAFTTNDIVLRSSGKAR